MLEVDPGRSRREWGPGTSGGLPQTRRDEEG